MIPAKFSFSLGSLEVGVAISTFLYGVTTMQAYVYASSEHNDGILFQIFVLFIWLSEGGHTFFLWMFLYSCTITNVQLSPAANILWYFALGVDLGAFAGSLVQAFFAYRVKALSGKWWIAILAWIGALLRLAVVFAAGIVAVRVGSNQQPEKERLWIGFLLGHIVVDIVVDLWNTGSLCYYLAPDRNEFSRRTRTVVNKLMLWAMETGAITCVIGILWIIFTCVNLPSTIWLAILMFNPKFYSISLLVSLNSRTILRNDLDTNPTYRSVLCSQGDIIAASSTRTTGTLPKETPPRPSNE